MKQQTILQMRNFLLGLTCVFLLSCGETSTSTNNCSETAQYRLTFTALWSADTHPTDFPGGAHFSALVGLTHNAQHLLWRSGEIATEGVELMAETGGTSGVVSENMAAIQSGVAENSIVGSVGFIATPGSDTVDFSISEDFSLVSIVTMIAPSPDWFIGVDSLNLCENDSWQDSVSVDLQPYDSGTDSGVTFTSANADVTPHEPIAEIVSDPLLNGSSVPPLGTFLFERQ